MDSVIIPVCEFLGRSGCWVMTPLEKAPFVIAMLAAVVAAGLVLYAGLLKRSTR